MKVLDASLFDSGTQDEVNLDTLPLFQPSVTEPLAKMWHQDGNQTPYIIEH